MLRAAPGHPRVITSDEGWEADLRDPHLLYYVEDQQRLRIEYDRSRPDANGKRVLFVLYSPWRWEPWKTGPPVDRSQRQTIVDRVRAAIEFLGYGTDMANLEISGGLKERPRPVAAQFVDNQTLQFSRENYVLTVQFSAAEDGRAEINLADMRRWDPPHPRLLTPAELTLAMAAFTEAIRSQLGCPVLFRK